MPKVWTAQLPELCGLISVIYKLPSLSHFVIESQTDYDSYLEGAHFWQAHNGRDVVPLGYQEARGLSGALYDAMVAVASFLLCKVRISPSLGS